MKELRFNEVLRYAFSGGIGLARFLMLQPAIAQHILQFEALKTSAVVAGAVYNRCDQGDVSHLHKRQSPYQKEPGKASGQQIPTLLSGKLTSWNEFALPVLTTGSLSSLPF